MMVSSRRKFLKCSAATVVPASGLIRSAIAKSSPNETVNVAVMGIRGQGAYHLKNYPKVPNVKVTAICDIDERLFQKALGAVETATGKRPKTYTDIRRWSVMSKGGHFAALEQPEALAREVVAFSRDL